MILVLIKVFKLNITVIKLIHTNSVRSRVRKPGFTRTLFHIIQVAPYHPLYIGTPGS